MKRAVSFIFIMIFALRAFAQEAIQVQKTFWDDPTNNPMLPIYLVTGAILVVFVLVGIVAIHTIRVLNMLAVDAEKQTAQKIGAVYKPRESWWTKFLQKVNASVPLEQEKDIELDHSYDGIKELDNHLPPWWTWLFIGTIAWSVIYIVLFHFSNTLPLQEKEYQNELAIAEEQARKFKAGQPLEEVDENTLVFANDQVLIEKGKEVFMTNNCGSCHRNDGGGNAIGPNLTDEHWLHGGQVKQVFLTIKNGAVEKGMPAWGKSMSPANVRAVTFFVLSLRGTNPANAKGPQGELFKPAPVAADSTKAQASL